MPNDQNLKRLYDNVKKDGWELPDFSTFQSDMQDEENLKRLYDNVKSDGWELPDYNTFRLDMGMDSESDKKKDQTEPIPSDVSAGESLSPDDLSEEQRQSIEASITEAQKPVSPEEQYAESQEVVSETEQVKPTQATDIKEVVEIVEEDKAKRYKDLSDQTRESRYNELKNTYVEKYKADEETAALAASRFLRDESMSYAFDRLGLDADSDKEYRENIRQYYDLYQKENKEEKDLIELQRLDSEIAKLRDSQVGLVNPLTGNVDRDYTEEVKNLSDNIVIDNRNDFQKISDLQKKEYYTLSAIRDEYNNIVKKVADENNVPLSEGSLIKDLNTGYLDERVDTMVNSDLMKDDPELQEKLLELKQDWLDHQISYDASTRALLLNEDPARVSRGIFGVPGPLGDTIIGDIEESAESALSSAAEYFTEDFFGVEIASDRDYREAVVPVLQEAGVKLSEEQIQSGIPTFSEEFGGMMGQSMSIGAKIAIDAAVTKGALSAAGVPKIIASLGAAKNWSPKRIATMEKLYEGLVQSVAFEVASDETSAVMGAAEFGTAEGMEFLAKKLAGGKLGKFAGLMTRLGGRIVGGTVEEYAGDMAQNLSEFGISEKAFKETFGEGEEAWKKFLLTAAAAGIMGAPVEVMNTIKGDIENGTASGEITQLYNDLMASKEEATQLAKETTNDKKEVDITDEELLDLEAELAEKESIVFKDNIGETVSYNGEVGVLKKDGQTLVVESENKIQELGNAKDLENTPLYSMGVELEDVVDVKETTESTPVEETSTKKASNIVELDGKKYKILEARKNKKGKEVVKLKDLESGLIRRVVGGEASNIRKQFQEYKADIKSKKHQEQEAKKKAKDEAEWNSLLEEEKKQQEEDFNAAVEREIAETESLESIEQEGKKIESQAEELKSIAESELEKEVNALKAKGLAISNKNGDFIVRQKKDGSYTVRKKNKDSGKYVTFSGESNADIRQKVVNQFKKEIEKTESAKIDEASDLIDSIERDKQDAINSLLDKAINATNPLKMGNAFDALLGIPLTALNTSLKLVKATYNTTKSLSQSIAKAIETLKSEGYSVNETEYKKFVLNELKKKPVSKPTSDTKTSDKAKAEKIVKKATVKGEPIKKTVREKTGQTDTSPKVITTEAKALKEKYRNISKGQVATKAEIRNMQKDFRDFVRKHKESINKLNNRLTTVLLNKSSSIKDQKTLDRALNAVDKVVTDSNYKYILNAVNPKNWRQKGSQPSKGKIDLGTQEFFKKVSEALTMTPEEASALRDKIESKYKDINDISEADFVTLESLGFAGLESKPLESLEEMTQLIKKYEKEGRQTLKQLNAEKAQVYYQGVEDILDINSAGQQRMGSNELKNSRNSARAKDVAKSSANWMKKNFNAGMAKNENWAGLMGLINRKQGESYIPSKKNEAIRKGVKESFIDPINKAESNKMRSMQKVLNKIREKQEEIFGKNPVKTNDFLQEQILVKNSKGNPIRIEGRELVMTRDKAMYIYNLTKDESLVPTLKKMQENKNTKALIDFALKLVKEDKKLKDYADWVHEDYYPSFYERINKEYRKQYNIDLPFNPDYSPIFRKDAVDTEPNVLSFNGNIASTINGSLKERTSNTKELDLSRGLEGTMLRYADQMEHFINFTDIVKKLSRVFGNQDVKNSIEQFSGIAVNGVIDRFIKSFAGSYINNEAGLEWVQNLRKNFTTATLGLNATVYLKQLTSAPAYSVAEGVSTADYLKESGKMLTTKKGLEAIKEISNSDFIKDRKEMQGFDRDAVLSFERALSKGGTRLVSLRNKLMFMTKAGDVHAIILGGTPYYMAMKNKYIKQGMTETKAKEKAMLDFENATKSTQQSSNISELSDLQRGSEIAKLFTMFKTSPAQYFRKSSNAWRNLANKRGTMQDLKTIAMFQVVLPSLFTLASKGFMSDEDDIDDYKAAVALGNLQGLPFIGEVTKFIIDLTEGKDYAGLELIPAFAGIEKAVRGIVKQSMKGEVETEDLLNDVLFPTLEGVSGLPLKNAKKLTIDNLDRISKINSWEDLMKAIGYSDYALGNDNYDSSDSEGIAF